MKHRCWKCWVTGLALVQLLVLGFDISLLWPGPGVTVANFHRIEKGMPLADVEAILGGPAEARKRYVFLDYRGEWPPLVERCVWFGGPNCGLIVWLDEQGRVGSKEWSNRPTPLWDWLCWRFTRR
jgi:hypothetical protein